MLGLAHELRLMPDLYHQVYFYTAPPPSPTFPNLPTLPIPSPIIFGVNCLTMTLPAEKVRSLAYLCRWVTVNSDKTCDHATYETMFKRMNHMKTSEIKKILIAHIMYCICPSCLVNILFSFLHRLFPKRYSSP